VVDANGKIAAGTSTNGLTYKIPGCVCVKYCNFMICRWVRDTPIIGTGSYADAEVGGASCTGDGDVMMRFLPRYYDEIY